MTARLSRRSALSLLGAASVIRPAMAADTAEVWHYLSAAGEIDAIKALVEVANKQYPATPFAQHLIPGGPNGLRQQMQVAVLGGEPPSAYQSSEGYELATIARSGRLAPIDDIWTEVKGDEIFPAGIAKIVKAAGHVWGIPINLGVISNVFYNKAIFAKLGLQPPKTWDEFKAVCAKLKAGGYEALGNGAGYAWTLYNFYAALLSVLGAEGYYSFAAGEIAFGDERMRKAYALFHDTFAVNYLKNWSGYQWSQAADQMIAGKVGMYMVGDWASGYMKGRGFKPGEDYDFFAPPGLENITIVQSDSFLITAGAPPAQREAAKNFLRAAASPDGQAAFNRYKGSVAASSRTPTDIYDVIGKKTYDRLNAPGAQVIPNLLVLMPTTLALAFGTEMERYGANPTEAGLEASIQKMEAMRQENLKSGAFMRF